MNKKVPRYSVITILSLLYILLIQPPAHAQVPAFWGMTNSGGTNDAGVIFKTNPDGTGFTTVRSFTYTTPGAGGDETGMQLWQSPAGRLYGITSGGGLNGWGVLFEYDPSNGAYVIKHNFLPATGSYPVNSLVAGANGKLYGMTAQGGSSGKGVIYEFDYTTSTYTKKIDFVGTNGASPSGGNLYLHTNGKLYGFASYGGANNLGVLFEYDPATNTLVKKIDFTGANGKFPFSSLVKAGNNKLYSVTLQGGTADLGILFEYDPATNVLTKRVDFSSSIGSYPASTMVVADNGNLYGTTTGGGTSAIGVIYEFNPETNTYTKKIDATSANGSSSIGGLAKATNGKLYGLMYSGGNGTNSSGVLYEYDPANNTYSRKFDFTYDQSTNFSATGYAPRSTLVQASDGFLYGTTSFGGAGGRGTLFRYNPSNGIFNKRVDFNNAPEGRYPYAGLTRASNGKLYGMTNTGGSENSGTIVEIDPVTNSLSKRQDFTRTLGSYPQGSLVQAPNGKLYGLTTSGGANGEGTIFEFDPASANTYSNKYDFESNTSGESASGSLIVASNNKLYGMTGQGGANGAGTIFEYDPAANVFTKKADFDENTTGYGSVGELTQATNGKFYGLNKYGGLNGNGFGVLFEFDLASGTVTPRVSFNRTNGAEPSGSLLQAPNGKLYGMTGYGGANSVGTLFEYDPATNVFTKKIDFNGVARGSAPSGGLALSPNGKLYGGSSYGGANDKGVLFEYDPATNTLTKKIDFNGTNGGGFLFGRLLFVDCIKPAKPTVALSNENTATPTLTSSSATNNQWYRNGTAISGATNATFNVTQPGIYKVEVIGVGCNSDFSDDVSLIITGDIDHDTDIRIYPNPVKDWLTINLHNTDGIKLIKILDMLGHERAEQYVSGSEVKFYVGNYSAGLYFVTIKTEQFKKTYRFIKN